MPKPNKGEKKSEYIERCVRIVMKEGADQKAALGKCYGMWDEHKKKSKATIITDNKDEIIVE